VLTRSSPQMLNLAGLDSLLSLTAEVPTHIHTAAHDASTRRSRTMKQESRERNNNLHDSSPINHSHADRVARFLCQLEDMRRRNKQRMTREVAPQEWNPACRTILFTIGEQSVVRPCRTPYGSVYPPASASCDISASSALGTQ
jgi:hypothetical protein